jgi:hypothetical protein
MQNKYMYISLLLLQYNSCIELSYCIMLLLAQTRLFYTLLDHAKPEQRVQTEQAQVEDFTNLVWIKATPGASHHYP